MSAIEVVSAVKRASESIRYAQAIAGDVQTHLLDGENNTTALNEGWVVFADANLHHFALDSLDFCGALPHAPTSSKEQN